jgi:hypothetical protein
MAVPKRFLLLAAAAFTWFSQRYAPAVAISHGYIKNTVALFSIAVFVRFVWGVVIYPLFFSPLRGLPSPPVCCLDPHCSQHHVAKSDH